MKFIITNYIESEVPNLVCSTDVPRKKEIPLKWRTQRFQCVFFLQYNSFLIELLLVNKTKIVQAEIGTDNDLKTGFLWGLTIFGALYHCITNRPNPVRRNFGYCIGAGVSIASLDVILSIAGIVKCFGTHFVGDFLLDTGIPVALMMYVAGSIISVACYYFIPKIYPTPIIPFVFCL